MRHAKNTDYPFILGNKPTISSANWIKLILVNVLSVLILTTGFLEGGIESLFQLIPAFSYQGESSLYDPAIAAMIASSLIGIIFLLINLLALRYVVGRNWTKLFRRVKAKDLSWVFLFLILTFIVSIITGNIANALFGHEVNPADVISISHNGAWKIFFLQRFENGFQLMGEEFIAILPFLALIQLGNHLKMKHKASIFFALLLSSMLFAIYHFSTYNYNLGYALLGLTFTRMILTWSYMKTKNLWVSFSVHYLFDALSFLFSFLFVNR